jgi:nicotinamide-nucleotide amidase
LQTPPKRRPAAELLTIGDELLAGDTVNTNAAFLGTRARAVGLELHRASVLRDRRDAIIDEVRTAVRRSAVVLVSGGLGPTTDDLTTEAIAAAAERPVVRDDAAVERLRLKFQRFGRPMVDANLKQADLPEGGRWLANPIGTAEGFCVEIGDAIVFAMPGVPREMKRMMLEQVEPILHERFATAAVVRRVYRSLGMGESMLATRLEPIVAAARTRSPGMAAVFLHYRASMPEVTIVLEALTDDEGNVATMDELAALDDDITGALVPAVYGIGEADLATRVIAAATRHRIRIATIESCTGGLAAALLAAVPGASECLDGSIVAYDNRIKRDHVHVDAALIAEHGAVSEPVARAMAEQGRLALGSDLCVAITGLAGPGGGSPEKPVGTVHVAVADAAGTTHLRLQLRGDRGTLQRSAAMWAHKLLWDRLVERGLASIASLDPVANE